MGNIERAIRRAWGYPFMPYFRDFENNFSLANRAFSELFGNDGDTEIVNEKNDMKVVFPIDRNEDVVSFEKELKDGKLTMTMDSKSVNGNVNSKRQSTVTVEIGDEYDVDAIKTERSSDKLSVVVIVPKKPKKVAEKSELKAKLALLRDRIDGILSDSDKSDEDTAIDFKETLDDLLASKKRGDGDCNGHKGCRCRK